MAIARPAFVDAAETSGIGFCATSDPLVLSDDVSGIWSPCTVQRGALLIESTYLQNASAVGGTALAAYPMLQLRTGIFNRVEFVFHSPSQVAESGVAGAGLYPMTRLGYGARYTASQTARSAVALVAEVLPPMSRFSPTHVQSKYLLGLTSEFELNSKISFGLSASGTSSATSGFNIVVPSAAAKLAYSVSPATQVSSDLGMRLVSRHSVAQSFGDVSVDQRLGKRLLFNVGLGTAFNPVGNAKAHYLASGFDYHL